jgi:hypothetical protein
MRVDAKSTMCRSSTRCDLRVELQILSASWLWSDRSHQDFGGNVSEENREIDDEGTAGSTEISGLGTQAQLKLRKRYSRAILGFGIAASLFLFMAIGNVLSGRNSFGSIGMLVELSVGVFLLIPALWAVKRRANLDKLIAAGSTACPKHLKTWQNLLIGLIGVPVGLLVLTISMTLIAVQLSSYTSGDEKVRAQEILQARARALNTMDAMKPTNVGVLCSSLLTPAERGAARSRLMRWQLGEYQMLTQREAVEVFLETFDEYCGIRSE